MNGRRSAPESRSISDLCSPQILQVSVELAALDNDIIEHGNPQWIKRKQHSGKMFPTNHHDSNT